MDFFTLYGFVTMLSLAELTASQTCTSPTTSCDCFVDDNGKKIINCRYKNLSQIPTFTATSIVYDEIRFDTTEDTGQCYYNCNNITTLNTNAFANLKVKKVNLRNSPLSSVSNDAFDNLIDNLEELELEGNGLVDPPYIAIAVLENLKTLYLENYISSIIELPDAILPLPKLQSLTLTKWRNLHTLQKNVFSIMTRLSSLSLQSLPSLLVLPVPTIQIFQNLTMLEVRDTGIQSLPAEIFSPSQPLMEVRTIHNYNMRTINDRAFYGVSDTIEDLDLVGNKLSHLRFLSNSIWMKLGQLNIGYNINLQTIPRGIFHTMPSLTHLQCQGIGLTSIDSMMFSNLTYLQFIDLSYNNIRNIATGIFQNSPNLTELHLNHQTTNGVTLTLQDNPFKGIEQSLETLSLSEDKMNVTEIWSELQKLTNLKTLELQNVGISNIPNSVFSQNIKLESIDLSNNNISIITQESFFGPRNDLKFIDLQNNKITTLDSCVLTDFTAKPILYLTGNPLNCDCNLDWLYDWIHNSQNQETVYSIGTCTSPASLAGKYFNEFTRSDLCTKETSTPKCLDLYATLATTTTSGLKNPLNSNTVKTTEPGVIVG